MDRLAEGAQRGGYVQVRQAVNGAVRHPHQRDVRLPRGVSQRIWSAGEHRADRIRARVREGDRRLIYASASSRWCGPNASRGRHRAPRLYRRPVDEPRAPAVDQQKRALSYGARAELYDRVRPCYPAQALSCLLAALPAPPTACRVVEVGAGTGKLTAVLAQAGLDVDAVEPDSGMRAVLAERLPAIRVHAGRGEQLPLGEGSADAVVYGNSWHWVDTAAGAQEAARVLRSTGVLAMLWNYEDDGIPWVSALDRLIGGSSRHRPTPSMLQDFQPVEVTRMRWSREQDVAALPDYVLSHSAVAVLPARQQEQVLAAVRRLAAEHPELVGRDHVTVRMHVVSWIYHRHN